MMSDNYKIAQTTFNGVPAALITIHRRMEHEDGRDLCMQAKTLVEEGIKQWEISLTELTFCDSITLGICIMLHTTVRRFSGMIRFRVSCNSQVYNLMQISRLDRILTIVDPSMTQ
jgi:hypothetical protein